MPSRTKDPFLFANNLPTVLFSIETVPRFILIWRRSHLQRLQDISSHITFINICHNISRKSTVIAFAGPAEATGLSRRLRACPEWPQVAWGLPSPHLATDIWRRRERPQIWSWRGCGGQWEAAAIRSGKRGLDRENQEKSCDTTSSGFQSYHWRIISEKLLISIFNDRKWVLNIHSAKTILDSSFHSRTIWFNIDR